ncbi:MAG: hemolysin family protein [Pontiella sp.]|nr:hemolysin family protein [Pontiella sp.]
MTILFAVAGLLLLLCLSAFFSGSESALFSLDPLQVRRIVEKHPDAGRRIEKLLSTPSQLLSAILIGNTLVNVAASSLGHSLIEHAIPAYGVLVAVPVMTILLLIFGEVSPKRIALHTPERISVLIAVPIQLTTFLMKPLSGIFNWIDRRLSTGSGPSALTEDEYRIALQEGEAGGLLKPEERGIVEGIIRLESLSAADVMTPRIDLVGIARRVPPEDIRDITRKARFKFLPVYKESIDHIEGFLDVRQLLLDRDPDLDHCIITAPYVPETMPLDKLLVLFRKERVRVVCVTDEFGGTAGIVTQGDVAEEIVADTEQDILGSLTGIKPLGQHRWLIGGNTSVQEINAGLGIKIGSGNYNRVGGWIADQLDRIPRRGDVLETGEGKIFVHAVKDRRIHSVVFERRHGADAP